MTSAVILKASDFMNEADKARMAELKAEYSKPSTKPARMKEVYAEMKALRIKTIGQ